MIEKTPVTTIQLSAYYDAVATGTESDFGSFLSLAEDYYFAGPQRSIALGRLRREVRNNPYLSGLYNQFPSLIGQSNLRSRTSSKKYNQLKELIWFRWKKRVTVAGDTLRGCEEILQREMLVAGEMFVHLLANGRVQLIPSEYCGSPANIATATTLPNGARELNGIIYDANDRPLSYRFGQLNSSGMVTFENTTLIPAAFIIHVFLKDRVLMGRGLPWLLPSLKPAHDLYEITRSKTKQIKDANNVSGTIESDTPEQILEGLKSKTDTINENDEPGDVAIAETADAAADRQDKSPVVIKMKPGTFIALKPGEKLNMLKTQYQATDYKELILILLHAIATPIGAPVELWFSGLGDVSYSGFKGLGTQWAARRRHYIFFFEDSFLNRLQFWRVSKWAKEGDLPPNPDADDDLVDWAWRRAAVLDEEKEARANQIRLDSGECSLPEIWEEKGYFAEEVFAARRQTWIQLQIAAGELTEGGDHAAVKVPLEFIYLGHLPGTARPVLTPAAPAAPSPTLPAKDPSDPSNQPDPSENPDDETAN